MHRWLLAAMALVPAATCSAFAQSAATPGQHTRVTAVRAVYPADAERAGVRGPVVLDLTVDGDGHVTHAVTLSGHRVLARAAVTAAKRWRFRREGRVFHIIAGVNVAPRGGGDAASVQPSSVYGRTRSDSDPSQTPGRAAFELTLDGSGRVRDALGITGSRDMLIEGIDSVLRWETPPLASDSDTTFACRVEWVNGVRGGSLPPRCRLLADRPDLSGVRGTITLSPVIFEVVIEPNGVVRDVKVLRSNPAVDDKTIEAIRKWRFGPLFVNGLAIPGVVTVSVTVDG